MNIHIPENFTVVDDYTVASPFERILAFLIDISIFLILFILLYLAAEKAGIAWLGGIIAVVYFVMRDGIKVFKFQSIGKKIMRLKVIKDNQLEIRFSDSVKRNFIFLPSVLIIFGTVFIYGAIIFILFLFMIELYQMYTNSDFQRLGDQFADTMVVEI
jgi:uncharacterized RDD family membrane protein YckC